MQHYILSIDQGTTSTRAVIFDRMGSVVSQYQLEFKQYYPSDGWVEHDPEEIWQTTLVCCRKALSKAALSAKDIAAMGISNQRETTILWDRKTGQPVYRAIVWQDRRTAQDCAILATRESVKTLVKNKTGLLLDSYFSATKIAWILNNVNGLKEKAERGELAFGTIDSFLLWRLTNGKVHATDATNASRTLLFNIHTQSWDQDLLQLFDIHQSLLPEVLDSNAHFGETDMDLFSAQIPITGILGDQQAATIGQACFQPGMIKSTYGTGCFVLLNTGEAVVESTHQLLSTIAYRLNGVTTYGLEGSIFNAGTVIQWLQDQLRIVTTAAETEMLARSVENTAGVYFIPAFTGMGAPYWNPHSRGAILGLTRNTERAHIVRAALEAVCYQTRDLIQAMQADFHRPLTTLRVDGGMVANDFLLQFLSDILGLSVERPECIETSALGAAYIAGLGAGLYASLDEIAERWHRNRSFTPLMEKSSSDDLYDQWTSMVNRILS